uniref:Uncharacterized protein n=1 Tax=Gloeochaete wittrockiana TaxID=38269 RepID=A0A3G1IVX3_9EUKA|nr:hypothetical protein [Gloeochaete wittrockiana]ASQ40190.1 hypothetical protein [Gloeochaete wittrockiana]
MKNLYPLLIIYNLIRGYGIITCFFLGGLINQTQILASKALMQVSESG